ncbi:MAG: Uncharacterised protein [Crocinitomicaceae bacterium]|nr:MAG: Uncharacterised protein [Crocinitomicaceae bacterium]
MWVKRFLEFVIELNFPIKCFLLELYINISAPSGILKLSKNTDSPRADLLLIFKKPDLDPSAWFIHVPLFKSERLVDLIIPTL